jgi:hypothetical protein
VTAQAARPTIAALDGDVHLVWLTFDNFCAANDGPTAAARFPHIAVAPDHAAHIIFYDTRNSDASGAKVEIYYARPRG